jgi:hypothetical protein
MQMRKLLVCAFTLFAAVAVPTAVVAQTVPASGTFNGQTIVAMRFNGNNTITYFFDNGGQFTTLPMDPRLYLEMYRRFVVLKGGGN